MQSKIEHLSKEMWYIYSLLGKGRIVCHKIFSFFEKDFKNVIISIEKLHKLIDER